jgi:hypothetical protein
VDHGLIDETLTPVRSLTAAKDLLFFLTYVVDSDDGPFSSRDGTYDMDLCQFSPLCLQSLRRMVRILCVRDRYLCMVKFESLTSIQFESGRRCDSKSEEMPSLALALFFSAPGSSTRLRAPWIDTCRGAPAYPTHPLLRGEDSADWGNDHRCI